MNMCKLLQCHWNSCSCLNAFGSYKKAQQYDFAYALLFNSNGVSFLTKIQYCMSVVIDDADIYLVASLNTSVTHAAAMTALVEATAGMILFTTPWVNRYETPEMLNSVALSCAFSRIHWMCWGSSPSIFTSKPKGFSCGHSSNLTYSTQCSGSLGVCAIVHIGKFTYKK